MHLSSQISSSTITLQDSITNAPISNSPPITLLNETHQHPHRDSRHRRYRSSNRSSKRSSNRSSNRLLLNISPKLSYRTDIISLVDLERKIPSATPSPSKRNSTKSLKSMPKTWPPRTTTATMAQTVAARQSSKLSLFRHG